MTHEVLRPMTEADLPTVLQWRNSPEIRHMMFDQHEISTEEHSQWFTRSTSNPDRHLLIYEQNTVPIGFMNLSISDTQARIAEWGFYTAPGTRGSGHRLGTVSLNYAFQDLGLHKVRGDVLSFNAKSIRFHQRLGFSEEGRLRQQYFDGKDFHDILCFGLLAHEWPIPGGMT